MTKKRFLRSFFFFGLVSLLILPNTAGAFNFSIDAFEIVKNGSPLFNDPFADGNPPPSAPNFVSGASASYNLNAGATVGPESGGKLTLNSSGAAPTPNIAENGINLTQRVTLLTSQTGGATGLNSNSTFSVTGIFDLILPSPSPIPGATGDRYGIRLSDATSGVEGDDILYLRVVRQGNGQLAVQFRDLDDPANTNNLIDQAILDTAHDQIALRLSHPSASNSTITAAYAYGDGGVLGSFTTFSNTVDIFNGESFTRAQFEASATVPTVPEPASLLLLGAGLIGLVSFSRKRSVK